MDFYNDNNFTKNKILLFKNVTFTGIYKLEKERNLLLARLEDRKDCGIVINMETSYYSNLTVSDFGKYKGKLYIIFLIK